MIIKRLTYRFKSALSAIELTILNKRVNKYGYNLEDRKGLKDSEIVVENHFKSAHKKSALLSYIIYPFIGEIPNHHSNYRECYLIAEILNELGYNVDVINWDNNTFLPSKNYDLVIDNHNNLERLHSVISKDCLKIFHATSAHWLFQNKIEFDRHYEYFIRTGIALTPTRLLPTGNSITWCDAVSMLGNSFTKETYGKYANKVSQIPISVTTQPEFIGKERLNEIRYNFLWFNSAGFLLKGLDIVLDSFINMPECSLYVCGNFDRETDFLNSYADQLKNCHNVKLIGWVDTEGTDFKSLVANCSWVINTSFSEGGGGSTLNCMAMGLIPIVAKSASIDIIDRETGFILKENSSNALRLFIKELVQLPLEQIKEIGNNAFQFIKENHTSEHFKLAYKTFLKGIIKKDETV